jgi:hypothetical protein
VFYLGLTKNSHLAPLSQARALGQDTKHCGTVSNGPSRALGQSTKHTLYFRAEPEQERRMFVHVNRRKQL